MNATARVFAYIRRHSYLSNWPDAEAVLVPVETTLISEATPTTALPIWMHEAVGGDVEQAVPLAASFTLLHLAAQVLDDFQDQDTDAVWTAWPLDRVLTSVLAMIFLSQSCLARVTVPDETRKALLDGFAQVGILAAVGQNAPARLAPSLTGYWQHAQAKSGLVYAVGAWSGARLATDDEYILAAARDFGMALGALIQVTDDCRDFHALAYASSPNSSELIASLPVIMALEQTNHPAHLRLTHLLNQRAGESDSHRIRAICELVCELDGPARALVAGKVYEQKALAALAGFNVERSRPLVEYVQHFFAPVAP
jgi:geranylgeranyl diphosphate synthase type I